LGPANKLVHRNRKIVEGYAESTTASCSVKAKD